MSCYGIEQMCVEGGVCLEQIAGGSSHNELECRLHVRSCVHASNMLYWSRFVLRAGHVQCGSLAAELEVAILCLYRSLPLDSTRGRTA